MFSDEDTKIFTSGMAADDAIKLFELWRANLQSQLEECEPSDGRPKTRFFAEETKKVHRFRLMQAQGMLRSVQSRLEVEMNHPDVKSKRKNIVVRVEDIDSLLKLFTSFGVDPKRGDFNGQL